LLLATQGWAQSDEAPACGALCDLVDVILYATPLLCGVLGALLCWLVHRVSERRAATGWTGGASSWIALWLWPLVVGYAIPVIGVLLLLALTLANEDFRTLLLLDARSLPPVLAWAIGTLILPPVPLFLAMFGRN